MAIRDRGKLKWRPASFLPLAFEMQRDMFKDQQRMARPIIDEYEREEFNQSICEAMETNNLVIISLWAEGFINHIIGRIHYIDPITHHLRIEVNPGEFKRIPFQDVVGVALQ